MTKVERGDILETLGGPSEADRRDLHNGLAELLGSRRAETLAAALPALDTAEPATKRDLDVLGDRLRGELRGEILDIRSDIHEAVATLSQRIDRLLLTWVAGLIVIVSAMAGVVFAR